MKQITKTYTITATPDTLLKFERFLAMMHWNRGHSALFGMSFDGDGHERLKVDPEPPKRPDHWLISRCGPELEVAYNDCYMSFHLNRDRTYYKAKNGVITKSPFDNHPNMG